MADAAADATPWRGRAAFIVTAWVALDAAVAIYLARDGGNVASSVLLTAALLALLVSIRAPATPVPAADLARVVSAVVVAELGLRSIIPYRAGYPIPPIAIQVIAAAVLAAVLAAIAVRQGRHLHLALAGAVAAGFAARILVVGADIPPHFDVPEIQRLAAVALLNGQNPYLTEFWPGGYPYLPVAVVAAAGGLIVGDVRWASIAADAAIAASIALVALRATRSVQLAAAVAALWAWNAGSLYVTWQGFPDPVLIAAALVGVVVATHTGRYALAGILVGVAAATKQFGLALVVVGIASAAPTTRRLGLAAAATLAVILLPFALWDPGEFLRGAVVSHIGEPARAYALNLLVPPLGGPILEPPLALVGAAALAAGILASRGWQDPIAGWVAGSAGLLLVAFLFNPIAFVNYYLIVLGLLLAVLALAADPAPGPAGRSGA